MEVPTSLSKWDWIRVLHPLANRLKLLPSPWMRAVNMNKISCLRALYYVVLLRPTFATATATKLPVVGESLCNPFESDVTGTSQDASLSLHAKELLMVLNTLLHCGQSF